MLKTLSIALLTTFALAATPRAQGAPAQARLQLSFDADGSVNLVAQNVTVRDILALWAHECGCYIVNGDRLPARVIAIPLQFDHKPQDVVLDSLLRTAPGYLLTPRRAGAPGPSNYETIYILATSTAVPSASVGYTPVAPPLAMPVPLVTPGAVDDEIPPVVAQPAARAPQTAPAPTSTEPARPASPPGGFVPAVPIVPITPNPPVGAPPASPPSSGSPPSMTPAAPAPIGGVR